MGYTSRSYGGDDSYREAKHEECSCELHHHHKGCKDDEGRRLVDFEYSQTSLSIPIVVTAAGLLPAETTIGQLTFDDTCSGDLVFISGSVRLTTVLAIAAGATLNIRKSHRYQNPLTGAIVFSEPVPTVALTAATNSIFAVDFVDVLNNVDEDVIYTITISATAAVATTLAISSTITGAEYR